MRPRLASAEAEQPSRHARLPHREGDGWRLYCDCGRSGRLLSPPCECGAVNGSWESHLVLNKLLKEENGRWRRQPPSGSEEITARVRDMARRGALAPVTWDDVDRRVECITFHDVERANQVAMPLSWDLESIDFALPWYRHIHCGCGRVVAIPTAAMAQMEARKP